MFKATLFWSPHYFCSRYSGDLNTGLAQYSNGLKLSNRWMVQYSDHHLDTRHLNMGQVKACYSDVFYSDPHLHKCVNRHCVCIKLFMIWNSFVHYWKKLRPHTKHFVYHLNKHLWTKCYIRTKWHSKQIFSLWHSLFAISILKWHISIELLIIWCQTKFTSYNGIHRQSPIF